LTGTPTAPTAANNVSTTQIATTEFVRNAVANLVDGAPALLDTLNELAAAINDDASFSELLLIQLVQHKLLQVMLLVKQIPLPWLPPLLLDKPIPLP